MPFFSSPKHTRPCRCFWGQLDRLRRRSPCNVLRVVEGLLSFSRTRLPARHHVPKARRPLGAVFWVETCVLVTAEFRQKYRPSPDPRRDWVPQSQNSKPHRRCLPLKIQGLNRVRSTWRQPTYICGRMTPFDCGPESCGGEIRPLYDMWLIS